MLPFIALVALGVVQVAVLAHDQVLLTHAAREAARAAAVSEEPDAARHAAQRGGGLRPDRLAVTTSPRGEPGAFVEVRVTYTDTTDVPLIGALLPDLALRATASMRVEG